MRESMWSKNLDDAISVLTMYKLTLLKSMLKIFPSFFVGGPCALNNLVVERL